MKAILLRALNHFLILIKLLLNEYFKDEFNFNTKWSLELFLMKFKINLVFSMKNLFENFWKDFNSNTNYLSQLIDLNFDFSTKAQSLRQLILLTVSYLIIVSGIKIFIFL